MNKQILIIVLGIILPFNNVKSQEISLDMGTSFGVGLNYPQEFTESSLKPEVSLGASFVYKFTSKWALVTGVQFGRLHSTINIKKATIIRNSVDDRNNAFELIMSSKNFTQEHRQHYYKIPLLAQYTFSLSKTTKLYGALGCSFYRFLTQSSKVTASSISVSGYYPNLNIEVKNIPNHGFGTLKNVSEEVTTAFDGFTALSIELGFRWNIKTDFYLGVFLDYGLTDIYKEQELPTIHRGQSLNGKIFKLKQLSNSNAPKFLNFGLKLRVGLFRF